MLTELDKRLLELQGELLKLANSKVDYEDVADEIHRLREEKQTLLVENANKDELKKRLSEMESFLQNQPKGIREYDEQMVRRLIEKVLIFETKVSVEFKSGVTSNTII